MKLKKKKFIEHRIIYDIEPLEWKLNLVLTVRSVNKYNCIIACEIP